MSTAPSTHDPGRAANVLGALALVLTDCMSDAAEAVTGQAVTDGTALSALVHVLPPDPTIDLLRQVLGITHSGAVRLVDRLEQSGHVRRVPGIDRRSTAIRLTASGRRAATRVAGGRIDLVRDALDALSADEQEHLADLAGKVLAGLRRDPARTGGPITRWTCRLCDTTACGRAEGRCPVAGAQPPSW